MTMRDAPIERDEILATVLRFETNLVLRAGAGSGKTEALTSLAVHLLSNGMQPERLIALTFTEKAAAEMRERIARRIVERGAALEVERAQITTLHAFAAALLRAHALEAGLAPSFVVVEDADARRLARRAAARTISATIRSSAAARDLVDAARRTWSSARHLPPGLGDLVVAAMLSLAETGSTTTDLLSCSPYTTARVEVALEQSCRHLGIRVPDAHDGRLDSAIEAVLDAHVRALDTDGATEAAARSNTIAACRAAAARWRAQPTLDARQRLAGVAAELATTLRPTIRNAPWLASMRQHAFTVALLPVARAHAEAFAALVADASSSYAQAKRERGVLDFGDLLLRARALLRDRADVRHERAASYDALLVDEAQDTSPVQRDLIRALHEDPDRPGALRSRGLLLVGDRKQSIYGFRGADVAVLDELTRDVLDSGGRELPLRECYRSLPPLVAASNAIAGSAMRAHTGETFEVVFEPGLDALVAVREGEDDHDTRVELLVNDAAPATAARARVAEADAIARRVRRLVEKHDARFGDIALLLPRMTHVGRYGDAFDAYAVPYVVEGGRGLLETEEHTDLLALATVLCGELDDVALAAVLRSPFVALSDLSLVSIATERGRWPRFDELAALAREGWPEATNEERTRLELFVSAADDAARDLEHTGIGRALRSVVDATGYDAVLSALPDAEGRVANLDLLLTSAQSSDEDPRAWARRQRERVAAGETEREADLATADMDVVHVMTVHQSKGREYPVVIVADCGRAHAEPHRFVSWDPAHGLAVRVALPTGGHWLGPGDAVVERAKARETAERARLLYVAATRARDRLIFVGEGRAGSWRSLLDTLPSELVARSPYSLCGEPPSRAPSAASVFDTHTASPRLLASVLAPRRLSVTSDVVADLAVCARRHHAFHELHIGEADPPRVSGNSTPFFLALPGSPTIELRGRLDHVARHDDDTYDVITRIPIPAAGLVHYAIVADIARHACARATQTPPASIRSGLASADGTIVWIDPIFATETALAAHVRELVLKRQPPPHPIRDLPLCQSISCSLLPFCHGDRIDVLNLAESHAS